MGTNETAILRTIRLKIEGNPLRNKNGRTRAHSIKVLSSVQKEGELSESTTGPDNYRVRSGYRTRIKFSGSHQPDTFRFWLAAVWIESKGSWYIIQNCVVTRLRPNYNHFNHNNFGSHQTDDDVGLIIRRCAAHRFVYSLRLNLL